MEHVATIESQLKYRLFREGDEEGILRLWEKESGWGAITMQQFKEWFLETPYGECLLVVATDNNDEVKTQIVFAPSKIVVNNQIIKSLRAAAPIVDSSLRQTNLRSPNHPIYNLIKVGFEIAESKGYQSVYSFPAYGWMPFMEFISRELGYKHDIKSYECFDVSLLVENATTPDEDYHVSTINQFSPEHEQLWNEAVEKMPVSCAIARELPVLNRLCGPAIKFETRHAADNRLIGFLSVKKDGLMYDIVARNLADLKIVFEQTIANLQNLEASKNMLPGGQLKGMITKETENLLENISYTKNSYHFAFGCWLLDKNIDFESLKTSRWYMTPLG